MSTGRLAGVRWWLRRRSGSGATPPVILLYHRVAEVPSDPWGLAVAPSNFREHMRVLSEKGLCISLTHLVRELAAGNLPSGRLCVTFDDGYLDNLLNAKPTLDEFSIPATFFLTSGYLQGDREFWWDALERPFFEPTRLPDTLEIQIEGALVKLDFHEDTEYRASAFADHRQWRAWDPPPSKRHLAYYTLWQSLSHLAGPAREMLLDKIRHWAGISSAGGRDRRPLSSEEVRALASGTTIEVGGHSISHPELPRLSLEEQRWEIAGNKERLEALLARPLRHFAYPHGEHSEATVSLVKEAGYASACTTDACAVDKSTDPFHLPRIYVGDWDGDGFARRLDERFTEH